MHLDRAHDLVRRLDCAPQAAPGVVESSALDLVDVVASAPETVPDAVGWWLARARERGVRVAQSAADIPVGGGVLAVDGDQQVLAEALDQLDEDARVALLLRDSYDLPVSAVAVALAREPQEAMHLVGQARLAFLALTDEQAAPELDQRHVELAALARLGEGGPVAASDGAARRHALSCESCRQVTDAQQRAHLLLSGLTVVAIGELDRSALLARISDRAARSLPSSSEVALVEERERERLEEQADRRLLSPLLALAGIVLAVLAGTGVGLLLSRDGGTDSLIGADGDVPAGIGLLSPTPMSTAPVPSPPTVAERPPRTSVFEIAPPPPPPPPSPAAPSARLTLSPRSGPNGTEITVTGSGLPPATEVAIDYLDPTGAPTGSSAAATTDARGGFTATLAAQDPTNLPGDHAVRATAGARSVRATFTSTG